MNADDDEDWLQVLFDQPNPASNINEGNHSLQSLHLSSSSGTTCTQQRRTGHKRSNENKTDPQQLEAQKRWRQREKMRIQDLQAELDAKAAQAEALTTLNTALERKQQLLESVLAIRDDQLRALQREAASPTQQQLIHTNAAPSTNLHAESLGQQATATAPTELQTREAGANQQNNAVVQFTTQMQGTWLKEPPPPGNELTLKCIPPHHLWDAQWMARMRQIKPVEWRAMWQDFVKESSMYVLAAEAHGPGSQAYNMLTQVVSHHLGVLDRITLLTPAVYYESLYMNLMTGEQQPPPEGHWAVVAKAIGTTSQQVHECLTALQSFESTMQQVMKERSELAARISQQLSSSINQNVPTLSNPQHHNHHIQQKFEQQQQQQQQQQIDIGAVVPDQGCSTAEPVSGLPGASVTPSLGSVAGDASGSTEAVDLAHLTQQLSSNVSKEHAAHNTISDFLCTRVLNVVQLARAAAVSWPWLPDVTAILKEGLAAMNIDQGLNNLSMMMQKLGQTPTGAGRRGALALPRVHHAPVYRTQQHVQHSNKMAIVALAAQPTQPVMPEVFKEADDPIVTAYQAHQETAPRPSGAEDARTWAQLAKHGVLATIDPATQFPAAAVVEFAVNEQGLPIFACSTMSPHTSHMIQSGRISLAITAPGFQSLADGRISLVGTVREVNDQEKAGLREIFLKKYPNAFYVDFGDFKWFVMDELTTVRYLGGFALLRRVTPEQYMAALPDPVAAFSNPVCQHMNEDHQEDNLSMVRHYTKLSDAEAAKLIGMDKLGLFVEVTRQGQTFKARLPFVRPAEDRKAVKDVIVEMTRAARVALKAADAS